MATKRRIEGWFSLGVLLLVIGIAMLSRSFSDDDKGPAHSVTTAGHEGRRGFFLVLQELGFHPRAWDHAPGSLPHGGELLWLPAVPKPWHAGVSKDAAEDTSDSPPELPPVVAPSIAPDAEKLAILPSHSLEHYRRFVEEGGTLVARVGEDPKDGMREFLAKQLALPGLDSLESVSSADEGVRRVRLTSGEELDADLGDGHAFRPLESGSPGREVWLTTKDGNDQAPEQLLAVEFPLGAGRVIVLAQDSFLDNGRLRANANALLGVRLVEEFRGGGEVLFDEYALELWQPDSMLGLAWSPSIFLLSAHALLLLALFVWGRAWARAFERDPLPLEAASPIERAQAQARIWASSGRLQLAARALRRGVLGRLERASGLRARSKAGETDEVRFAERVERLCARRRSGLDPQRARSLLRDAPVANEAALDELGRALAELEGQALAQLGERR